MEDVSVVLPDASLDFPGILRCGHFAIYDWHSGRLAAEFAKHLHLNVLSAGLPRELVSGKPMSCSSKKVFQVFIANIGDAKTVFARSSTTNESGNHTEACTPLKAIVLTREHKAIYPQERSRIQKVFLYDEQDK
ncbi:probable protein phosphatase 2C 8 [Brassica napus]|uniref:probable protein phosphatase 2C 8 n=1 Tax=Brassica napus TaxID=3708 RepID=UPI002078EDD8|nr:probable protein phosphatase 2C 8 [Brassica napus]XP_048637464.1 probable protein phosphatase 2C 8 [Brassica napus]